MEKLWKPYGSISDLIFFFFFSSFSPILSEICLSRVTGILRKHYGSPISHFLTKRGRSLPPSSPRPGELPRFENCYLHPYLDKFTPNFCVFGCFLSETSQNFTDSRTMSVKPSEAIENGPRMKLKCNSLFTHPTLLNTLLFLWFWPVFPRNIPKLYWFPGDGC